MKLDQSVSSICAQPERFASFQLFQHGQSQKNLGNMQKQKQKKRKKAKTVGFHALKSRKPPLENKLQNYRMRPPLQSTRYYNRFRVDKEEVRCEGSGEA